MLRRSAFVVFVLLLSSIAVNAQQHTSPAKAPEPINLDVVVTPAKGPPVPNLQQQQFVVLDNKTPVSLTSFHAISGDETPLHVVLVVDAVNISYQNLASARDQIGRFLRANGGRLPQPTQLAFFTDSGTQIQQGFSTDGNALSSSLDKFTTGLRNIRRSSQWGASDRLQLSLTALQQIAQREAALPGRKLIFWVSPGWPLLSGPGVELTSRQQQQIFATIVGLSTQLRRSRITLYSVDPLGTREGVGRTFYYENFVKGITKPNSVMLGDVALQVIAVQTGGLALSSSNDVASLLQTCMADTAAYYQLSFAPAVAEHPDEYHHIEVRVATPGFTARTREGYYAQP